VSQSIDKGSELLQLQKKLQNPVPNDSGLSGLLQSDFIPRPQLKSRKSLNTHSPTASKRKKLEMDNPMDLTGRYKEKTIHKFLKDDILDIIRSQNAVFQPFFDPETYPDLELIVVDGKISNYCHCRKCRNVLCFFAINATSGGKVQTNTIRKHKGICTGNTSLSFDSTANRITSPLANIIEPNAVTNAMTEFFPPCIKEENSQSLSFS